MSISDHFSNGGTGTITVDLDGLSPRAQRRAREFAAAKRAIDLTVAIPLLILAAPIFAVIALWIAFDSPGPILFRQRRLGQRGKPFHILKFRTMTVLEDGPVIVQARQNDARITRAGRWLRKTSFDELPQLINVIRGEMSLVGPRPHAIAHDRFYGAAIGDYAERQWVKPGITGWAQVHGCRGETPTIEAMRRRVAFDIWYAHHASITLDLKILLLTAVVVLRQRSAY